MRIDSAVTRRKYQHEVEIVRRQNEVLRKWGCWIVDTTFPQVDAVFVPRHPLKITFPVTQSPGGAISPQTPVQLVGLDLHSLAGRAFGARIDFTDFDQRALSVTFHDPWTWDLLPYKTMIRATNTDEHGKRLNVLLGDHPKTKLPFLCMRGIREYHEHPQHSGDDWMLYRGATGLFTLLSTIWRTSIAHNRPNVIMTPPNIRINWEAHTEN